MKPLTANDAEYGFGQQIGFARAGPIAMSKYGRLVMVVFAVEEFERLKAPDSPRSGQMERRRVGQ